MFLEKEKMSRKCKRTLFRNLFFSNHIIMSGSSYSYFLGRRVFVEPCNAARVGKINSSSHPLPDE